MEIDIDIDLDRPYPPIKTKTNGISTPRLVGCARVMQCIARAPFCGGMLGVQDSTRGGYTAPNN